MFLSLCFVSMWESLDIYNTQNYSNRILFFYRKFLRDYRNKGIYTQIIILIIEN